jgi:tripartite-type tricarboxylate transporter receptor subunit TctC
MNHRSLLGVLAGICMTVPAYASPGFPSKPIRLVLPLAPGGATDVLARTVGREVTQQVGQSIVIDNRPGAGGIVASELVAKSSGDGYTLLFANFATHAVTPTLFPKLGFDPVKSFIAISLLASQPHVLLISPGLPVKSVADLVRMSKTPGSKVNYASSGVGSPLHLAGELFRERSGANIAHVPYKSSGPALVDLTAGSIEMMFDNISTGLPFAVSGKVRALAVTSQKRSPLAPDLPTVSELGIRNFETYGWWGVLAPSATPPAIVKRLEELYSAASKADAVIAALGGQGFTMVGSSGAEFSRHIDDEIRKWRPVIQGAGLNAN